MWSKNVHNCQHLYRRKCQRSGVFSQKSKNLVNVVFERPLTLTWLFHNNAMPELLRRGGSHKNELEYSVEQIINPISGLSWVYTWYLDKSHSAMKCVWETMIPWRITTYVCLMADTFKTRSQLGLHTSAVSQFGLFVFQLPIFYTLFVRYRRDIKIFTLMRIQK